MRDHASNKKHIHHGKNNVCDSNYLHCCGSNCGSDSFKSATAPHSMSLVNRPRYGWQQSHERGGRNIHDAVLRVDASRINAANSNNDANGAILSNKIINGIVMATATTPVAATTAATPMHLSSANVGNEINLGSETNSMREIGGVPTPTTNVVPH